MEKLKKIMPNRDPIKLFIKIEKKISLGSLGGSNNSVLSNWSALGNLSKLGSSNTSNPWFIT